MKVIIAEITWVSLQYCVIISVEHVSVSLVLVNSVFPWLCLYLLPKAMCAFIKILSEDLLSSESHLIDVTIISFLQLQKR